MTSCKKDWTCECKNSTGTYPITLANVKKADAKKACDTWNTTYAVSGGSCTLK